jgi:hypothetical protein
MKLPPVRKGSLSSISECEVQLAELLVRCSNAYIGSPPFDLYFLTND